MTYSLLVPEHRSVIDSAPFVLTFVIIFVWRRIWCDNITLGQLILKAAATAATVESCKGSQSKDAANELL